MNADFLVNDWAGAGKRRLVIWGLPALGLVVTGYLDLELHAWPLLLLWMGLACVLNARRCRRLHCYFTGPFFIAMSALSLLHGLKLVPLGTDGWNWLGWTILVGWLLLHYGIEAVFGKYRAL